MLLVLRPPCQLCPYSSVHQDWSSLGTYTTFEPLSPSLATLASTLSLPALVDASLGIEPGKGVLGHRVMSFENGAVCHNGVVRQVLNALCFLFASACYQWCCWDFR